MGAVITAAPQRGGSRDPQRTSAPENCGLGRWRQRAALCWKHRVAAGGKCQAATGGWLLTPWVGPRRQAAGPPRPAALHSPRRTHRAGAAPTPAHVATPEQDAASAQESPRKRQKKEAETQDISIIFGVKNRLVLAPALVRYWQ